MKKRILRRMTVIAMIVIGLLIAGGTGFNTTEAEAASASYHHVIADNDDVPRDKIGKYYIWTTNDSPEKMYYSKTQNGKKTLIKKLSGNRAFCGGLVTNGYTIYYAVLDFDTSWTTIYRTNIRGTNTKKILKHYDFNRMAGYYNGSVYFNTYSNDGANDGIGTYTLMKYNIKKKKLAVAKRNFQSNGSCGRYFVGSKVYGGMQRQYLYNGKTNKTKKLIKAINSTVTANKIYYVTNPSGMTHVVKSSNLSGKKVRTLKRYKNTSLRYLGKKAAYFTNVNSYAPKGDTATVTVHKYIYGTKKTVNFKVKEPWML